MSKNLISIVLCTWNSEKTISETILSLYNQTYKDFEVIVVDKNSTDRTIDLVKQMFPESNIVQQKGSGIYNAFNEGIKAAQGELIFILNSDDYISSNGIFDIVNFYKKTNFDSAFLPVFTGGGFKNKNNFKKLFLGCDYCFVGHSASFVIKKEIHTTIGYYDEKIKNCADHDFFMRLMDNGYIMNVIDTLSFGVFRPGGFSSRGNYFSKRLEEYRFRVNRKKFRIADFLYCYIIFPLQACWSIIKIIKQ